jgi:predicted helicase
MQSFNAVWIVDLHGNMKKNESSPDGSPDTNVFDIQQGVAISVLANIPGNPTMPQVAHSDLYGNREKKYSWLSEKSLRAATSSVLCPNSPFYLFIPQDQRLRSEYDAFIKLTDIMPVHSNGIVTGRDHLCIRWSKDEVLDVIQTFATLSTEKARNHFDLGNDSRDWQVKLAQKDLVKDGLRGDGIKPIYYRPFDIRWTYYTGRSRGFLCMPRPETMRNMVAGKNIALITSRMTKGEEFRHVQVTRTISEAIVMSPKTSNNGFIFPLYLRDTGDQNEFALEASSSAHRLNFSREFLRTLGKTLEPAIPQNTQLPCELTPEDVFRYFYAILHSPLYRSRYTEYLRIDFPRVPLTGNVKLFRELALAGGQLIALHLFESPRLENPIAIFSGPTKPEVEKISYTDNTVWIDKTQTNGFRGVPETVWNFHIGGYQVCEKWLKDRKGRTLSKEDIDHYQRIVVALAETIRIMAEIDKVIDAHGGWPGAFVTTESATSKKG